MINYTKLQAALLQCLIEGDGQPVSLESIHRRIYRIANKAIPKTSMASVAGLVRSTSKKIKPLRSKIDRVTPLGNGNRAAYTIKGNFEGVKNSVAEYRKVFKDDE